jgi:predicted DNA-binding transcriptional regulator YafY
MRWDMQSLPHVGPNRMETGQETSFRPPSLSLPLARLLQLLMLLQFERFPNARRLAEACAVSRRTIYRDLAILDAAGITVLYRPDRQGYQLKRDCWLQPTQLEDKEALALLIMSRVASADDPFGLLRFARSGLTKILQALPSELRGRIAQSAELIPDETDGYSLAPERQAIYDAILSALLHRRKLRLVSRELDKKGAIATDLGIYRLARLRSQWNLIGHSSFHDSVTMLAVPSIASLETTTETYSIPPRFRLDRFLKRSAGNGTAAPRYEVQLRFAPRVIPAVQDRPRSGAQKLQAGPGGQLDLFLSVDELDEVVFWVLGFGDQVEVLKPAVLRNRVRDWAQRIAQIHSNHDA